MKKKLFAGLFLSLISSATLAAKPLPVGLKKFTFNPVSWHATIGNGGFSLENQTNKTQYVQVTIETGEISVSTINNNEVGKCRKDLKAQSASLSVICELGPKDRLIADLDFSRVGEATGTYQVEMEN